MLWQYLTFISSGIYPTGIMLNIHGQLCLRKDESFNTPRNIILSNLSFVNLLLVTLRTSIMFSGYPNYNFSCIIQYSIMALHLMSTILLGFSLFTRLTGEESKKLVVSVWLVSVPAYLLNLFEIFTNQFLSIIFGVSIILILCFVLLLRKCCISSRGMAVLTQDEKCNGGRDDSCKFVVIPVIIVLLSTLIYITPFLFYLYVDVNNSDRFWSSLDILCTSIAITLQPAAYLFLDKNMRKIFYKMWNEPKLPSIKSSLNSNGKEQIDYEKQPIDC